MGDATRARRVSDRIRGVVAEMLGGGRIKDPRLGFVTVTDVRLTGDLQHATVFYTVLGDAEAREATAAALESARGVLRSAVGRATGLRLTPTLEFQLDEIPEGASHLEEVLAEARERDAAVAALAAGAAYAGDPDPYRRRDEDEADPTGGMIGDEPDFGPGLPDVNAEGCAVPALPGTQSGCLATESVDREDSDDGEEA
jgi:ribosome-binding factor A